MLRELKSTQNPYVKLLASLTNKRNVQQNNLTLVESEKVVRDLLAKPVVIKAMLAEPEQKDLLELCPPGASQYIIHPTVSKKISQLVTPSNVFCAVQVPEMSNFDATQRFLVLDNLQDPSNLGALVRSALAFGYKQIVLLDSTYPFTPKVIRASMGYVFDINFVQFSKSDFVAFAKQNNLHLIGAKMDGESVLTLTPNAKNFGLVIGNEGQGISEELLSLCNQFVRIDMQNEVESLNATVSASILLHALDQKTK